MVLLESSLSVATGFLTAVGLGTWLPIQSFAGRILAGLLFAPLLLILLNIIVPVPLSNLSLLISAVSVVGWIRLVSISEFRDLIPAVINPALVLPVFFVVGLIFAGDVRYQIFEWDEFASWLNWTKELYLNDSLTESDMIWRNLGYPQAWPMALAIPQLNFATFDPMRSLAVGVLWHAAVLGLVYEVVTRYLANIEWASPQVIVLAGYALIFVLLAAETFRKIVPQDFLIELPQTFALAGVFSLLFLVGIGQERLRGASIVAGLILAAGLLIKVSVIAAVPAAAIIVILLGFGREYADGGWKDSFVNLGFFLLPIVIVQFVWIQFAGKFESRLSSLELEFGLTTEHLVLLARILDAAWNYIVSWKMPMTLFAVAGVIYGIVSREFRPMAIGLTAYIAIYGFGLLQLYAFRFGPFEVAELQSLQRYIRVPLRLTHVFGLVILVLASANLLSGTKADLRRHLSVGSLLALFAAVVIFVGGFQIYAINYGITEVRDRFSMSQKRLNNINALQDDRRKLERIIADSGIATPTVALIAQGDDGFAARVVSFLALPNRRSNTGKIYKVIGGYSWGETRKNPWMRQITATRLAEILSVVDIIWVHQSDAWMDGVLGRLGLSCKPSAIKGVLV